MNLSLWNLYLLRRLSDPGFVHFIMTETQNSANYLKYKKKLINIWNESLETPNIIRSKIAKGSAHTRNVVPLSQDANDDELNKQDLYFYHEHIKQSL